jgi:hypothetical protein
MIYPIKELLKKRKNDEAIFLGCGPSINDMDLSVLENKDIWANNNFILHKSITPHFYHLELKEHRNGPTFRKLIENKREEYGKTNWILNRSRPYLLKSVNPNWFENIYMYQGVPVYCLASISIILQIMAKMGYKKIYFNGVDLYDSKYFWTDDLSYDVPSIMNSCKPDERKAESLHPTQERNIAEWISSFLSEAKIEGVNLSPKSVLAKHMRTE